MVYDDSEDLAMGSRRSSVTTDRAVDGDDTEFGTRAAAAISTALDLEKQEEREEQESLAAERRQREIDEKEADA